MAVPVGAKIGNMRFRLSCGDSLRLNQMKTHESDIARAVASKISSMWIAKIRFDGIM
jgi:hypothetical protein